MFLAKRRGRAERHVSAGIDVANRETGHGQRETPLLRQGHFTGVPKALFENVHERMVLVVERFQLRMFVAPQRGTIVEMLGRR